MHCSPLTRNFNRESGMGQITKTWAVIVKEPKCPSCVNPGYLWLPVSWTRWNTPGGQVASWDLSSDTSLIGWEKCATDPDLHRTSIFHCSRPSVPHICASPVFATRLKHCKCEGPVRSGSPKETNMQRQEVLRNIKSRAHQQYLQQFYTNRPKFTFSER